MLTVFELILATILGIVLFLLSQSWAASLAGAVLVFLFLVAFRRECQAAIHE
jgi:hypothetical protein